MSPRQTCWAVCTGPWGRDSRKGPHLPDSTDPCTPVWRVGCGGVEGGGAGGEWGRKVQEQPPEMTKSHTLSPQGPEHSATGCELVNLR